MSSGPIGSTAATEPGGVRGEEPLDPIALPRGAEIGRYLLIDRMGAGAMGVVYAAFDPRLDRKVALKLLRGREGHDPDAHRRMLREAKALARLSHPNVVALHDVGEYGGRIFIAMEFVQGPTLRAWLETPRSWPDIVEMFLSAGRGLVAAHAHGLVHCDFKPDNAVVGDDGRLRVMDFGLARPLESANQTAAIGTPAYMAPEQHRGESLDASADQFSFCVALYEALYRERPFPGDTAAAAAIGILRGRVRRPPRGRSVPKRIWRILERGLAATPVERWPTMAALLDALAAARRGPRRLIALGAIVGAGLAVLAWQRIDRARAIAGCDREAAAIDELWNEDARARAREGLRATGSILADDAWVHAEPWLDRHASEWQRVRGEACRLAELERTRSADLDRRARACLEDRKDALAAVLDLFAAADENVVTRAVVVAASVPAASQCSDEVALARHAARPSADREQRRRLASARSFVNARGPAAAQAEADMRALAAAHVDSPALLAESTLVLGVLQRARGDQEAATENLSAALRIAGGNGDDDLAFEACDQLALLAVNRKDTLALGLHWSELAEVFLMRLGVGNDERRAVLLATRAALFAEHGRYDDAADDILRALEIRERIFGPTHPLVAQALIRLADVQYEREDREGARTTLDRALSVLELALGPDHPQVASALSGVGSSEFADGAIEDATAAFERALAIPLRAGGRDDPAAELALQNLGIARLAAGDPGEALAIAELQAAQLVAAHGEDDARVTESLIDQGRALLELGRPAEALQTFERARALRERAFGRDHPRTSRVRAYVGRARLELGDPRGALRELEPALALLLQRKAAPEVIAMTRFAIARALWIVDRDRPRAIAFAFAAKGGFLRAGERWDADAGLAAQWLADNVGI